MPQKKLTNPLDQYYTGKFKKQPQEYPGIQSKMEPVPDCGEKTYKGSGMLKDRKMLVTGGDSGIGRAAAIAYAREGADVAINYLPAEQSDAEEVRKLIEDAGRKAVLIPGDLREDAFCTDLVEKAYKELGGLDNVTLVAGRQVAQKSILDITPEQLRETYQINIFAMFFIVQAALKYLQPGATIVTTTSIQGYEPSENLVDYASTKAAIRSFTLSMGKQLAPKGIRVNGIAPGPIWTPLQICGGQPQEDIPEFGQKVPLKRAGQPAELAHGYVYLASEASGYITSEVLGITGGMFLS